MKDAHVSTTQFDRIPSLFRLKRVRFLQPVRPTPRGPPVRTARGVSGGGVRGGRRQQRGGLAEGGEAESCGTSVGLSAAAGGWCWEDGGGVGKIEMGW